VASLLMHDLRCQHYIDHSELQLVTENLSASMNLCFLYQSPSHSIAHHTAEVDHIESISKHDYLHNITHVVAVGSSGSTAATIWALGPRWTGSLVGKNRGRLVAPPASSVKTARHMEVVSTSFLPTLSAGSPALVLCTCCVLCVQSPFCMVVTWTLSTSTSKSITCK